MRTRPWNTRWSFWTFLYRGSRNCYNLSHAVKTNTYIFNFHILIIRVKFYPDSSKMAPQSSKVGSKTRKTIGLSEEQHPWEESSWLKFNTLRYNFDFPLLKTVKIYMTWKLIKYVNLYLPNIPQCLSVSLKWIRDVFSETVMLIEK